MASAVLVSNSAAQLIHLRVPQPVAIAGTQFPPVLVTTTQATQESATLHVVILEARAHAGCSQLDGNLTSCAVVVRSQGSVNVKGSRGKQKIPFQLY